MSSELYVVAMIVLAAVAYIGWQVRRGLTPEGPGCHGGGCGSCPAAGPKSTPCPPPRR